MSRGLTNHELLMIKTFYKILLDLNPIEIEKIRWIHSSARSLKGKKASVVVVLEREVFKAEITTTSCLIILFKFL